MPKTLKQLVQLGQMRAPEASIEDISYLISERAGLTPSEFQLKQDSEASSKLEKQLQKDFKKLARNVSPQYILGYAWFLGYKIMVQRGVLIPRFETEELVEWALDHLHDGMRILDLGTGSGAIMVALAKEASKKGIKDLTLYASDISDSALRTCEENFLTFDLDVTVRKANVLIGLEKFDLIISNPPYIRPEEKNLMDSNVLQNEPEEALFGGKDGLEFYRRFAKQVREHLTDEGQFFLEFGFSEKDDLAKLFTEELPDFKVEFKDDLAGKPRMVYGKWQK
ncbi:peptide chain release factor N(5)-glutamine methyltransferase [Lactobacillus mulieris]|jgi:protein-(glutamine-N5) methyltransferase, release factor-specific|uniref:peptide chain release factor N(5)-glutamine methyltransferase n=1 Tax=Lactobacillus mulieris TaxID=2508708 RepID=A0AAP3GY76_9LACO|nr:MULTISPECIES: peptide chain release factor N(5)-glutamine methyltransferase [Lactobacillus]EEU21142.1 protein-(glutamine-N5) methyltransferase, release factor-specific [Lactobacillus jensenii 27-2-CHN]EEX24019.1 protein-(glutamine-N5) methyltransferase, release factor-specific [Lactobacillus jensenii 115-3-CHN]EFH29193.1 protein-(glutamine-N5) methyltransferase, release factor-specific [Lactobacillus jensenii JV-V16]KAA9243485.1 peptide chain release factor N(5)-glutamine methyltransferase [